MERLTLFEFLVTGNEEIDAQHRNVISVINDTIEAVEGKSADQATPLLERFTEAFREHLQQEEAVLARTGFPRLDEHRRRHAMLLAQARAFQNEMGDRPWSDIPRDRINALIELLIDDVVGADMDFVSYLEERGAGRA